LTYSGQTGLLTTYNDKISEFVGCNDIWKSGRSIYSLRQMFEPSELIGILKELQKIKETPHRTEWEFARKITLSSGQRKWLNFKIVAAHRSLAETNQIFIISVFDTTLFHNSNRTDTIQTRLNSLNENRKRNSRVKAVIDHVENEMEELAFELHDELGVNLSHIKYGLQLINDPNNPPDKDAREKIVSELTGICQSSITKIRRIYDSLAPAGLKEFGLETIVRRMIMLDFKTSSIKVHLDSNLGRIRFSDFIELNYYRMAQELLDNSRKYSNARNLYLILRYEYNRLTLMVADDGIGFNPDKVLERDNKLVRKRVGNGLRNIQERCKILNCTFTIFAARNEGCRVTIEKEIRSLL
jgi:signal transduction histidine kinase